MGAQVLQFAGSFAAVAVLVLFVHLAGFSRGGRLQGEREARELAGLTPGGFDVADIALAPDGSGALALGSDGRLLLLKAHGARFVAIPVNREALRREGEVLTVHPSGSAPVNFRLGPGAPVWASG